MWFLLLVSTLHTLVVARSGKLRHSGKPCDRQEQPIVNTVCIKFEYITKVRYFTNRLKAQSTYHYLYTNKRTNLHLMWHPLISIEKKNSIEIIVGITYLGSSKTVSNGRAFATRLPTVSLRLLAPFPRLVAIMAQLSYKGDRMVDVRSLAITYHFSAT